MNLAEGRKGGGLRTGISPPTTQSALPKLWKILLLISIFLKFSFMYFLFSGSTKEGSLASGRTKSKVKSCTGSSRTNGRFS